MSDFSPILCDGCGQPASPEHVARRLQRLEWATRYRPIHLHTLLLGAVSPQSQAEFFYSPDEIHTGEAAHIFEAAGIHGTDKIAGAMHSEFQRRGLFVTHILECPLDLESGGKAGSGESQSEPAGLFRSRLPMLFTRIRRSLKPKRLVLISGALTPLMDEFTSAQLGCELVLDGGQPFAVGDGDAEAVAEASRRLQDALGGPQTR